MSQSLFLWLAFAALVVALILIWMVRFNAAWTRKFAQLWLEPGPLRNQLELDLSAAGYRLVKVEASKIAPTRLDRDWLNGVNAQLAQIIKNTTPVRTEVREFIDPKKEKAAEKIRDRAGFAAGSRGGAARKKEARKPR